MPPTIKEKPIWYFNIGGKYHERKNYEEALKVVSILENEILSKDGEYPSVGIATFNLDQRNLILELIKNKRINDSRFREKIIELEKKEMFVKNLENIQGDERDIIIISTTFGKNEERKFYKKFGPILQDKGPKLLNVIFTRAKERQIIVTSFPEEEFSNYNSYLKSKGISGIGILFSYLAYSKAVSENDDNQIKDILQNLRTADDSEPVKVNPRKNNNSLAELIKNKLSIHGIPKDRIELNFSIGGFICDLFIEYAGNKLAIDIDSSNINNIPSNYHSYIFKKKQLDRFEIKYFTLWSIKYWQNQNAEINNIVNLVLE